MPLLREIGGVYVIDWSVCSVGMAGDNGAKMVQMCDGRIKGNHRSVCTRCDQYAKK